MNVEHYFIICRTNLPKEVMGFPDFPFQPSSYNGKSFIFHEEVLDYLRRYAAEFDLERLISVRELLLTMCYRFTTHSAVFVDRLVR